ncbi:MAG: phosphotransferase, partial [Candidatus Acidiferrales bacterium]
MDRLQDTAQDAYRLIVTRRDGSEVLLSSRDSAWSLPSVEISRGQRIAAQLCAKLYAQCGFRAYCLLVPTLTPGNLHCAVMEVPDPGETASAGTCWIPLDAAICAEMESAEDRTVTQRSLEELGFYRREPNHGPFARLGWLPELFAWSEQQLSPLGVHLTGSFTQLNASPTFSLMRLETNDTAVWFKATGEPNLHEFPVTLALARLFPEYVPRVLGVHTSCNGWLSEEAPGMLLEDCEELAFWERVARKLAELQLASVGKCAELLESSCKDLRLPELIKHVDPFLARMAEFMVAQVKRSPQALDTTSLTLLSERLKEACALLHELHLPDTLGHVDFNPGNIVVSPTTCCFLDWAEGCVSHPFLTFEYLREHLRRRLGERDAAAERITAAYLRP